MYALLKGDIAKSPNKTTHGKIWIGTEIDSDIADILESEAARTRGGMDALFEKFFLEGLEALSAIN